MNHIQFDISGFGAKIKYMTFDLIIQPKIKQGKISVEMDLTKFERVVNYLNLFGSDFLRSVEKSEDDFRKGKFRKIKSLKSLRKT